MVVVLPVPAAPMSTSTTRPEVAICSTAAACSADNAVLLRPLGVAWRRVRWCRGRRPGAGFRRPGSAGWCRGSRSRAARLQTGCADSRGVLGSAERGGGVGDGDPVGGGGEADALQLAVDLGQDVAAGEGGALVRDLGRARSAPVGRASPDRDQRAAATATGSGRPSEPAEVSGCVDRAVRRDAVQLVGRARPGCGAVSLRRVSRVACWRSLMTSAAVGGRRWSASNCSISASFDTAMACDRWENACVRVSGTPSTSHFTWSECAR